MFYSTIQYYDSEIFKCHAIVQTGTGVQGKRCQYKQKDDGILDHPFL